MSAPWRERAQCRNAPTAPGDWTMFPEDRHGPTSREYYIDVSLLRNEYCWQCPVRVECLRDGLEEEYGLWGGLTQDERRRVTQLACHCGEPIDPRDMLDRNRRHFCVDHMPICFDRTVSFKAS